MLLNWLCETSAAKSFLRETCAPQIGLIFWVFFPNGGEGCIANNVNIATNVNIANNVSIANNVYSVNNILTFLDIKRYQYCKGIMKVL